MMEKFTLDTKQNMLLVLTGAATALCEIARESGIDLSVNVQVSKTGLTLMAPFSDCDDKGVAWVDLNSKDELRADAETAKLFQSLTEE